MSIKAENIIADGEDYAVINGVNIRKGTMGAALANADVLMSNHSTAAEKMAAKTILKELAAVLSHTSFNTHLNWKSAEIQQIFEETKKND